MKREMQRRQARERVLLALYGLADADGLACRATNAQLARASGRGVEAIRSDLLALERDGHVFILPAPSEPQRRVIILLDHPCAVDLIDNLGRPAEDIYMALLGYEVGLRYADERRAGIRREQSWSQPA